jgi:hypothetical protein
MESSMATAAPLEHPQPPSAPPSAPPSEQRPVALEDQLGELAKANASLGKLTKSARVAGFNGWSLAICAAAALPFAPFHASAAIMCVGLGLIAFNEFRGRTGIRQLDPDALRRLGWNQIALVVLLCAYAAWKLYSGLTGPNPWAAYASDPQLAPMLRGIESLYRLITIALYAGMIAASGLVQGFTSAYYFRRGRQLTHYLANTPAWVIDFQKTERA